jgi:hypothetical protein
VTVPTALLTTGVKLISQDAQPNEADPLWKRYDLRRHRKKNHLVACPLKNSPYQFVQEVTDRKALLYLQDRYRGPEGEQRAEEAVLVDQSEYSV